MIDLREETPIGLTAIKRPGGGRINAATAFRWVQRGIRGVKLESLLIGGQRYTTEEALQRFFVAATAAAGGLSQPVRSPRNRERATRRADAALSKKRI